MRINFFALLLNVILIFTLISCTPDSINTPNIVESSQKIKYDYAYNTLEIETINAINAYRVSIGLIELNQNNYLSAKSEEHNNYMIEKNEASHDNFSSRFQNISEVLGAISVGENIVFNTNTSKSALNCWLLSPKHKENIEGDFTDFGISIRVDGNGKKYFTNIFAKR